MRAAHGGVGAGEQQRVGGEGARHAQRGDEKAAIAANITRRTAPSSGSTTLVSQA